MLCQACQSIFHGPRTLNSYKAHHLTLSSLHLAAQAECWICDKLFRKLWGMFWKDRGLHSSPDLSDSSKIKIMLDEIPIGIEKAKRVTPIIVLGRDKQGAGREGKEEKAFVKYVITKTGKKTDEGIWGAALVKEVCFESETWVFGRGEEGEGEVYHDFNLYQKFVLDPSAGQTEATPLSPLSPLIEDEARKERDWPLALAKGWLETCIHSHPNCSQKTSSDWVPTRILELNAPEPDKVRLIVSENKPLGHPYMTLSHCWGKVNKPFILTSKTFQELSTGITVTSLPQTFHDATKLTLAVGVKYLWIDSLCIFQDSAEDWTRESSTMGQVYRNGICNLAATGSKDANNGMSLDRPTRSQSLTRPCYQASTWDNVEYNTLWNIYPKYQQNSSFLDGPLLRRGWVVQERIMSLRTLHVGLHQLYWECHQYDACETYPIGFPPIRRGVPELVDFKHRRHPLGRQLQDSKLLNPKESIDFWNEIVSTFTGCDLTFEEDKLIALSGVATELQEQNLKCKYFAGIWEYEFERNLLWRTRGTKRRNGRPMTRPKKYRAPSWSWASIDGIVTITSRTYYNDDPAVIKVLHVSTEPLNQDPTGQIRDGVLQVRGPLMTVSIRKDIYPELWARQQICEMRVNGIWAKSHRFKPDLNEAAENLHLMPVQKVDNTKAPAYICLLLQPTGDKKGQFRRWGIIDLALEPHEIEAWKLVENEGWFEFEEYDGAENYTVTII